LVPKWRNRHRPLSRAAVTFWLAAVKSGWRAGADKYGSGAYKFGGG